MSSLRSTPILAVAPLKNLCRLLGAPIFYSIKAWQGAKNPAALVESSGLLLFIGGTGLALAVWLLATSCIRRNVRGQQIEFLGLALIAFNLCVAFIVVLSRVETLRDLPVDAAAPRYVYWSSLFWTGMVLVALHYGYSRRWLRWPALGLAFLFAIGGWQQHRDEGLHWRYARLLADEGATSLINGVTDPDRLLAPNQDRVAALLPALRARRLDMFAMGLQDWIGQPVSRLQEKHDAGSFRGQASIKPLSGGADQDNAVKVTGRLVTDDSAARHTMLIVAPDGTIAGIARSFHTSPFLNRLLFGGRMPQGRIAGYIRDYDPGLRWSLRPTVKNGIASQQIPIQAAPTAR